MRISNTQIGKVMELHLHHVRSSAGQSPASAALKPDHLVLSSRASDVTRARDLTRGLPDLRVGIVKDFRGRVETGAYKVSGLEVADNLLASVLINRSNL